jgi:flagellar biogenesis protein FliO
MGSSVAAVLFVFALLGLLLVWARRAAGGSAAGLSLRVVDAVSLGSGRSVTVVRSGERFFLLGATTHSISLIAEFGPGDVAACKLAAEQTEGLARLPAMTAFLRSLRNAR